MQRLRVLIAVAIVAASAASATVAQEETARVDPGAPFPPMTVQVLPAGGTALRPLNLGTVIGKSPILICYFLLGEAQSEDVFTQVQEMAGKDLKGKVTVYGATRLNRNLSLEATIDRLSILGGGMPVIIEEEPALGRALGISQVPSLSLIDAAGVLRITLARSLKQPVAARTTMTQAVMSAAARGPVPTVTSLPRYYPANELVGEQFPDFILKQFGGPERVKMSDRVGKGLNQGKITALLFWHPNCKHCKRAMPGVVAGLHSYAKYLDVVSIVDLKDEAETRNCQDTVRAHKIEFPVLEDEGRRITDMYKVISTPTMFFLRPDGVVDSVYTSGNVNYVPVFSSRIQSILGVGRGASGL